MKRIMLFVLAGLIALGGKHASAANPGIPANYCISEKRTSDKVVGDKIYLTNNCGQEAFVIYCGELKYTSEKCGQGSRGKSSCG